MEFYLYKGLKKPLIFLGLKDKYIFYAIGSAVLGLIATSILPSILGGIVGAIVGLGIGALALFGVFKLQDTKGLYNKTKNNNERHIFPNKIKLKKIKR